jgi:hypothetical protein
LKRKKSEKEREETKKKTEVETEKLSEHRCKQHTADMRQNLSVKEAASGL